MTYILTKSVESLGNHAVLDLLGTDLDRTPALLQSYCHPCHASHQLLALIEGGA